VLGRGIPHRVVPPDVPALVPGHLVLAAPDHEHVLDGRRALDGRVDGVLEREDLALAPAAVGRDDEFGLGVLDAGARESALKPPKTTEWIAPRRATASMATTASGIIGR
jgi:hypothetical protein